jgi:ribosome-associated protein
VLEDKKAEDILLLDIHQTSDFADYFIICTGTSDRMLQALSDSVTEAVRDAYHLRATVEGEAREGWLLVDFGDVIVHLFSPDRREYYDLEALWARAKVLLRVQ